MTVVFRYERYCFQTARRARTLAVLRDELGRRTLAEQRLGRAPGARTQTKSSSDSPADRPRAAADGR